MLLTLLAVQQFVASGNAAGAAKCFNALIVNPAPDLFNLLNILDLQPMSQWQNSFNQMQPANFNDIAFAQENVAETIRQIYTRHLYEEQVASECPEQKPWHIWAAPFVDHTRQHGKGEKLGYRERFAGATTAGDYKLNKHWLFTGGFSFASTGVHIVKGHASADFKTYAGTLGTLWTDSSWYADALFSYLFNSIDARRHMKFSATAPMVNFLSTDERKAFHHQDSNQVLGHLGGGYNYKIKTSSHTHVNVYPFIDLDYIYVTQNGYTERGAQSLDLKVHQIKSDMLRPEGGLGIGYSGCFKRVNVLLDVSTSYAREFRFLGKKTKARFKSNPCEFTVESLFPKNNLFCPAVRLALSLPSSIASLSLGYHGQYGANFTENTGDAELKFGF